MKARILVLACIALIAVPRGAIATQSTETAIVISAQNAGPSPFIKKLTLTVSDITVLKRVRFAVTPKPGSVTRPISATYSKRYLGSRGYLDSTNSRIVVPVFGLYAGYNNTVELTYLFNDGSSRTTRTIVGTQTFDDPCHYSTPAVRQPRSTTKALSYDYMLVATNCGTTTPAVIDTDGAVRWVGTTGVGSHTTAFYNNGIYLSDEGLLRIELDGVVTRVADLQSLGIVGLHHSIDRGKYGLILDANTVKWVTSVNIEIDGRGKVLNKWFLGDIVRRAMIAGGDDPSGFVRESTGQYQYSTPSDWFHNNSVAYRKSDDSLIISSRENFVICLDYETKAIKWILGDKTKEWYQYPSLRKYALELTPGSHAPLGQHSVSITKDDHLLLFDNGQRSAQHHPLGYNRSYSAPRKYELDLAARTAREVWNFPNNQSIRSPFRSSVYEDAPDNYLVHYSNAPEFPRILGVTAAGEKVFDYSYSAKAFRSVPLHWERLMFITPAPARLASAETEASNSSEE